MKNVKNLNKIKDPASDKLLYTVTTVMLALYLIIIIYPLVYIISSSFSSGQAVRGGKVLLWPVDFSTIGYELILQYKTIWIGYGNTLLYVTAGTTLNIICLILGAYPLSRRDLKGRGLIVTFFTIPMFIGGGLIPAYIQMTQLGLTNNRWGIIVGGLWSFYSAVVIRTYFQTSVPNELFDAARIDGCSDTWYLMKVLLPLSKPVIAVQALFGAVGRWNSFFSEMIYLRDRNKWPLQLYLREILLSTSVDTSQVQNAGQLADMTGAQDVMKFSLVIVSTLPILLLFPFIQKYFEKGMMLGSVKG